MKREIVLLQQAHVSFVVPNHLQGALHSTVRLHALPEGRRCEGDGPIARPGLCEGQAWWWGVTGVGSAGVQMQEHEGSHSVLSHASSGRQSFLCVPVHAPQHVKTVMYPFLMISPPKIAEKGTPRLPAMGGRAGYDPSSPLGPRFENRWPVRDFKKFPHFCPPKR